MNILDEIIIDHESDDIIFMGDNGEKLDLQHNSEWQDYSPSTNNYTKDFEINDIINLLEY